MISSRGEASLRAPCMCCCPPPLLHLPSPKLILQRKGGTSAERGYDEELNEIHVRDKTVLNTTTDRSGWGLLNQQGPPYPSTNSATSGPGAAPSVVAVSKPNSTTTVTTAIVNLPTPSPNGDSDFPTPALGSASPASQGVLRISSL